MTKLTDSKTISNFFSLALLGPAIRPLRWSRCWRLSGPVRRLVSASSKSWLAWLLGFGAAGAMAGPCADYNALQPKAFVSSVRAGAWSDPATWGGTVPGRFSNVRVMHDVQLTSGSAREVQVFGDLTIAGDLHAYGSVIVCSGGELTGTRGSLQIHVADDRQFSGNETFGPLGTDFHPEDTGLWVFGRLDLNGPPVTSWVDVAPQGALQDFDFGIRRALAIHGGSATLARIPVGWQPGDTLVLTSEQGDHSLATLVSLSGNLLTYVENGTGSRGTPLTGYVLDYEGEQVKPKIGNLSRRFQVIAADVTDASPNHRSHVTVMGWASLNNVEFRNLGPRAKLGRYPVHWHLVGNAAGQGINGSSIWSATADPGNRWLTIHSTQGLSVHDNLMYRSQGHGIFMEAGDEFDNSLVGNMTVAIHHPEELPNVDERIFPGTSHATNHYWVRQGNTYDNNVAVGHVDDIPINRFPEANGLALLPSTREVDTVVDGFVCLGCGGFGAWSYVDDELVRVDNSQFAYSRVAGWYPVLNNTEIANSTLLMNGWNSHWAGQIFFNSAQSRVLNSSLAGYYGVHNHYAGRSEIIGGSINAEYAIDPTYWETLTRVIGTEITAGALFWRNYPNLKRQAPVPIWFDQARLNGAALDGMFVRHTGHSRYFNATIGSPLGSGIQVVPEPGHWLPHRTIDGIYQHRYYRSVTPVGENEWPASFAYEHDAGYQQSLARGDLGYPHGFPAGQYIVRYYRSSGGELLFEEGVTLGGAVYPQQPPVAFIDTGQTVFADTDGLPGEFVTLGGTAYDLDGNLASTQWLLDGEFQASGASTTLFLADGQHVVEFRAVDDRGASASDTAVITIREPARQPPEAVTVRGDATPTDARIRVGATADSGSTFDSSFLVGESIQLLVYLEPELSDLGAVSDVFVLVAPAGDEAYQMLTREGLVRWDGNTEHLIPFDERVLAADNEIDVLAYYGGKLQLTLNEIGTYRFIVGYIGGDGVVVYMEEPFELTVSGGSHDMLEVR